jgi:hypothetical protein
VWESLTEMHELPARFRPVLWKLMAQFKADQSGEEEPIVRAFL